MINVNYVAKSAVQKIPTHFYDATAANFLNLVIDLGSGVNLLREFLGKSY